MSIDIEGQLQCASCESLNVKTTMESEEFAYGYPERVQVRLKTVIPVRNCADCGFQWTDHEAEEIHDQAVQAYLKASKLYLKRRGGRMKNADL
jgi:hypothetical protein